MDKSKIVDLIGKAEKARENSYCPYSGFAVGAALITEDGREFQGCNIENASYGATNCAERTAIFAAVSQGAKKIQTIAIVGGPKGEEPREYAYPCGICRQVMSEFGDAATVVIVAKNAQDYQIFTLPELLPKGFCL